MDGGIARFGGNAYRILGVDVDASPVDVDRRVAEIRARLAIGRAPEDPYRMLGLPLAADRFEDAAGRLRDAKTRLDEVVFWFREPPERAATTAAVGRVARFDEVVSRLAGARPLALHDLAVFLAIRALQDTERRLDSPEPAGAVLASAEPDLPRPLPRAAILAWERLVAEDAPWEDLERRAEAWGDPRVGAEAVRRVRREATDEICGAFASLVVDRYRRAGSAALAAIEAWLDENREAPRLCGKVSAALGRELDGAIERGFARFDREMESVFQPGLAGRILPEALARKFPQTFNDFLEGVLPLYRARARAAASAGHGRPPWEDDLAEAERVLGNILRHLGQIRAVAELPRIFARFKATST